MTKMYRVTQTGDIEEREDDKPLPKGFSADKAEIERAAEAIRENPSLWPQYLEYLNQPQTEGGHDEGHEGSLREEGRELDEEDRGPGQPEAAELEGQPAEGVDGGEVSPPPTPEPAPTKQRNVRPRKNK